MLPDMIVEAVGSFRNSFRQFRYSLYYLQLNPPPSVASRLPELVAFCDDLSRQFVHVKTMADANAVLTANRPKLFEIAQQLTMDLEPIPTVDDFKSRLTALTDCLAAHGRDSESRFCADFARDVGPDELASAWSRFYFAHESVLRRREFERQLAEIESQLAIHMFLERARVLQAAKEMTFAILPNAKFPDDFPQIAFDINYLLRQFRGYSNLWQSKERSIEKFALDFQTRVKTFREKSAQLTELEKRIKNLCEFRATQTAQLRAASKRLAEMRATAQTGGRDREQLASRVRILSERLEAIMAQLRSRAAITAPAGVTVTWKVEIVEKLAQFERHLDDLSTMKGDKWLAHVQTFVVEFTAFKEDVAARVAEQRAQFEDIKKNIAWQRAVNAQLASIIGE